MHSQSAWGVLVLAPEAERTGVHQDQAEGHQFLSDKENRKLKTRECVRSACTQDTHTIRVLPVTMET